MSNTFKDKANHHIHHGMKQGQKAPKGLEQLCEMMYLHGKGYRSGNSRDALAKDKVKARRLDRSRQKKSFSKELLGLLNSEN